MLRFSLFVGGAKVVNPTQTISFKELINVYNSTQTKELSSKLRSCTNEIEKKELKNKQTFFTPYGVFSYRNNKGITSHNSSLIAFDFDKLEQHQAEDLKQKFENLDCCLFTSISGSLKGVKAMILINDTIQPNERYNVLKYNANAIISKLGLDDYKDYLDLRQFVLSQPMYISYDDSLYYNETAVCLELELETPIEEKPQTAVAPIDLNIADKSNVYKYVQTATNKLIGFYNNHTGARHSEIARAKGIAGLIKAYHLHDIETEIYNAIETAVIGMYGNYKDAVNGNAIVSLKKAWSDATEVRSATLDKIIEDNKNITLYYKRYTKISEKSIKVLTDKDIVLILPISQISEMTDKYLTAPKWILK
jgi:hypothetical protein